MSTAVLEAPATSPEVLPKLTPDDVTKKAVCLVLRFSKIGNSKKLPTGMLQVDAALNEQPDPELLRGSKQLLEADQLKNISRLDNEIREYVYARSLPSLFKDGVYLLPISLVEEVEARLIEFRQNRAGLIGEFIAAYPLLVATAEARLRAAFNPNDYPDASALSAAFGFEWRYIQMGVPGSLKEISKSLFKREQQKAAAAMEALLVECRQLLRSEVADMVSHVVERLTGTTDDGKPKSFHKTMVPKIKETLEYIEARDLSNDGELQALTSQLRKAMEGVDHAKLKKDATTRDVVRDGFAEAQKALDAMLIDRPTRQISLEDE